MMRSTTAASRPFSSATRSRSAGSKAISPFIERAVMAATRSLTPISSASSSMHSWSIMVESMSAIRIFFRRSPASWTITSIGSDASRGAQRRVRFGDVGRLGQGEIAGDALGQPDDQRLRRPTATAIFASAGDNARPAGWETSVATSGMENSGGQPGEGRVKNAILIAGPTASGKSALALDLAEREGRRHRQRRFHAGLFGARRADRAAERRRARAAYRICSTAMSIRRTAYSTGAWLRDVSSVIAARRGGRMRASGRSSSAAPGSISARLTEGISRNARHSARRSATAGATSWQGARARPSCTHPAARGSATGMRAEAERRPAHRAGARGARRVGSFDPGMAGGARPAC